MSDEDFQSPEDDSSQPDPLNPESSELENSDFQKTRPLGEDPPRVVNIRQTVNGRFAPWYPNQIGRFEIHGVLGRGGFSVVYRAWDPSLKRWVAIKVPLLHCLPEPAARRHFLLEAEATARLEHRGIVAIYEAGTDGETPYIAMAECRGPSLAKWLADRANPVEPKLAAHILLQLAEAVQYSHDRGILHRDIKPGNVLLFPDESSSRPEFPFVPRLADFGLAKVLEQDHSGSRSTEVVGTPRYMAPESIHGTSSATAAASDVYSLGAILYTLLTGQPPFAAASVAETLRQIAEEDPVAPHIISSSAGLELSNVCQKCLEKTISQRYQSASELADDLRNYLDGRPVKARPLSVTGRFGKWVRRRPLVAGLSVVSTFLLSCLLILGIQYLWLWKQQIATEHLFSVKQEKDYQELRILKEEQNRHTELIRGHQRGFEELALAGDIHLAADARRNGDPQSALRILKDHESRLQTGDEKLRESLLKGSDLFAWRYLFSRVQLSSRELPSESQAVWDSELSSDHRRLVTCGSKGVVTLYELVPDIQRTMHRQIARTELNCVAISPDGKTIATGGDNGTVWLLDAETLAVKQEFVAVPDNHVYSVQYLPDGRLLAAGRSSKVALYDPASRQATFDFELSGFRIIESLKVSRDGTWMIAGSGEGDLVKCVIPSPGLLQEQWRFRIPAPVSGNDIVTLCLSPDEQSVFVSAGVGTILQYDLATQRLLNEWQGLSRTHGLDVTDQFVFLGDNDGTCTVLRRLESNAGLERICQWCGHNKRATCCQAIPEGSGSILSFDLSGSGRRWPVPVMSPVRFEPSPDARFFNARDCAGWTLAGELFRVAGRRIELTSPDSGVWKTFVELPGPGPSLTCARQMEETGEWLAADEHGSMFIFSADGRRVRDAIAAAPGMVITSIHCDVDGKTLAGYAGREYTALWVRGPDMALPVGSWTDSGKLRTEVGRILNDYSCVVVSPERRWIACAHESSKHVDILDAVTFKNLTSVEGHTEVVRGMCVSRKEELLVSVSHDRTLATWDPQRWMMRHQCSGQPVRLDAATMHPDGATVATFDYASRISLWDARVSRTILTVDESAPGTIGMAFSPNGRYLAAWDCFGRITLIDSNSNPLDRRPQTSSRGTGSDVLRE